MVPARPASFPPPPSHGMMAITDRILKQGENVRIRSSSRVSPLLSQFTSDLSNSNVIITYWRKGKRLFIFATSVVGLVSQLTFITSHASIMHSHSFSLHCIYVT
jgi:hypothetical protein